MSAQRMRMNIISGNMANANSTKTAEGGPYQRREVVVSAVPLKKTFDRELTSAVDRQLRAVQLSSIQLDQTPFRLVHNPGHPHADEKGYVKMPNVNVIQEMANMIDATRGYEANLAVLNTSKKMALKALEIAR